MGKVKKAGAVTRRHVKSSATERAKRGAKSRAPSVTRKTTGRRGRSASKKRRLEASKARPPAPTFHVRELDPIQKCGPGTSVKRLYRVDEVCPERPGSTRPHLVFLDRHGWYCEDGRDCPAVEHARKHDERARPKSPKHPNGPNHNGRMRA